MSATISSSAKEWSEPTVSLFFYGTLLHPAVLRRVIGHEGHTLSYQPAILQGYTRHHVKGDTYPAIIPWEQAQALFNDSTNAIAEPSTTERTVRGSLVTGFSPVDISLLDVFEGDEYERDVVTVHPFGEQRSLDAAADDAGVVFEPVEHSQTGKKAQTYVWNKPPKDTLDPAIWSYDTFVKDNLHKWVGSTADRASYADVDSVRNVVAAEESIISQRMQKNSLPPTQKPSAPPPPTTKEEYVFGHDMLKYFCFEEGYINLNQGSYGTCPRPVFEASKRVSEEIEANPDHFYRIKLAQKLIDVRTRLAKFINAKEADEVVMITNATHGINNVLHNIPWKADDILIGFTTSYGAISSTLRRYADAAPHPKLEMIRFAFPPTRETLLTIFRDHINGLERKPGSTAVAIIDGIISVPGIRLPWEEMVKICRENNIISIVDGAHMIGQIPFDVQKADPDFLVTNCHKWMYARRPCSLLYVPKRNQSMMRWTFPVSWGYKSPPNEIDFAEQYSWVGTIDYTAFLSVHAAMDFREAIGGEQKIQAYCHDIARAGGKKMAEILGTRLIDEEDQFTACMVDVLLPLPVEHDVPRLGSGVGHQIMHKLLEEWHCASSVYIHEGRLWARCSGQIWLEVSDFEYVARALKSICEDLLNSESGAKGA